MEMEINGRRFAVEFARTQEKKRSARSRWLTQNGLASGENLGRGRSIQTECSKCGLDLGWRVISGLTSCVVSQSRKRLKTMNRVSEK